jgi:hypothetical protein
MMHTTLFATILRQPFSRDPPLSAGKPKVSARPHKISASAPGHRQTSHAAAADADTQAGQSHDGAAEK